MNFLVHAVTVALVQFLWQGAAVAALLFLVLSMLDARSARLRYAACGAAMLTLAVLPIITAASAYRSTGQQTFMTITLVSNDVVLAASLDRWAIPLWLIAMAGSCVRFVRGWWHMSRLRRSAFLLSGAVPATLTTIELRLGIRRRVRIALSHLADSPVMFGWWRPMIVLPASTIAELTQRQLEAVLAHELAHVRRHDYLVNVGQSVVETILAYHPATWWISARMREEREACCDDLAVSVTSDTVGYARTLLAVARAGSARHKLALGVTGAQGDLSRRIRRLIGKPVATSTVPGIAALLVAAIILACVDSPNAPRLEAVSNSRDLMVPAGHVPRTSTTPETIDSAVAVTRASRVAADAVGQRLRSIQITDLSAVQRAQISLPVEIGSLISSTTQHELDAALARTGLALRADVFATPGGAAVVIAARGHE